MISGNADLENHRLIFIRHYPQLCHIIRNVLYRSLDTHTYVPGAAAAAAEVPARHVVEAAAAGPPVAAMF